MGSLAPEQKKEAGQFLSSLFQEVETAFYSKQDAIKASERDAKLREEVIDWSIPSNKLDEGGLSLQNQLRRRVEEIFANM
jgi:phenylalanyl-tRNA synthetase alpha chain